MLPPTPATPSNEALFADIRATLEAHLPPQQAEHLFALGENFPHAIDRIAFYRDVLADVEDVVAGRDPVRLARRERYLREPVGIEEFVCGKDYLNKAAEIYPKVLEELVEINSGRYVEVVFTGGIGSAKTTGALYTIAYQLYLLSCLRSAHRLYGLDPASEILFVFQSINAKVARNSFERFRAMIEVSPYFQQHFPFQRDITTKMVFPNRVEIVPVSGQETAAIGQNVIGGMIDELNYMEKVEKSKQSVDGAVYDQAVALYNSIARRRKSRFARAGEALPGLLCLVSSKRYPGQFTDLKEEEAKRDPTIYIYDYRVWDVKPPGSFSGKMFDVFVGDLSRRPRVLEEGEEVAFEDRHLVKQIPTEYRQDFNSDLVNALREIAGVSTLARYPYLINVEQVAAAFKLPESHPSIFSREEVDFVQTGLEFYPERFFRPWLPRFVHLDLAISGDSVGMAIVCCPGFVKMKDSGFTEGELEQAPLVRADGLLRIVPPRHGEILLWKVRDIITKLMTAGLNIRWVTFDQFQSKDSQQLLRQHGLIVGQQSVDLNSNAYDMLKGVIYTGRMAAPQHARCLTELISLERDPKDGKIDHPPNGSKDVADALAGATYGLCMRREVWNMYSIPVIGPLGLSLREEPQDDARAAARQEQLNALTVKVGSDRLQLVQGGTQHTDEFV